MRIDRNRVKEYCSTIKEVLSILDFSIDRYSFSETKQDLAYKQSIRMCILDLNTSLGKYISHSLKVTGVCVTELYFLDMCKNCVDRGFLPSEPEAFYKLLLDYRNYIAHTYKQPSLEVLIKYTKLYRSSFTNVYNCIFNVAYNDTSLTRSNNFN